MAEEDDELEGMDDFDADDGLSSDQFDELMDDDLGGGDSDSELDSFFEDLSTVDDLEIAEEEDSVEEEDSIEEEEEEEDFDAVPTSFDTTPANFDNDEPQKKPFLIPAIISGIIGAILGSVAVAILAWMNQPTELPPPVPEAVVEVMPPMPEPPPPKAAPVPEPAPMPEPPPPKAAPVPEPAPMPEPPKTVMRYYVQVANCIYQECADDYRFLLQKYGYDPVFDKHVEVNHITEVVSQQLFGEEEATRWVNRINHENNLPGYAFRKPEEEKFSLSLGLFPDLNVAVRVKSHLNQLYLKQLYFVAQQTDQNVEFIRVRVGGDTDKEKMIRLRQEVMQKDNMLKDAFIVPLTVSEKEE